MSSIHTRRPKFLRPPRKIAAVFVMAMYLLAGALHTLCDLDVTNASDNTAISINKDVGQSEKGVVAEHHCHGCFSVSVPAPAIADGITHDDDTRRDADPAARRPVYTGSHGPHRRT